MNITPEAIKEIAQANQALKNELAKDTINKDKIKELKSKGNNINSSLMGEYLKLLEEESKLDQDIKNIKLEQCSIFDILSTVNLLLSIIFLEGPVDISLISYGLKNANYQKVNVDNEFLFLPEKTVSNETSSETFYHFNNKHDQEKYIQSRFDKMIARGDDDKIQFSLRGLFSMSRLYTKNSIKIKKMLILSLVLTLEYYVKYKKTDPQVILEHSLMFMVQNEELYKTSSIEDLHKEFKKFLNKKIGSFLEMEIYIQDMIPYYGKFPKYLEDITMFFLVSHTEFFTSQFAEVESLNTNDPVSNSLDLSEILSALDLSFEKNLFD